MNEKDEELREVKLTGNFSNIEQKQLQIAFESYGRIELGYSKKNKKDSGYTFIHFSEVEKAQEIIKYSSVKLDIGEFYIQPACRNKTIAFRGDFHITGCPDINKLLETQLKIVTGIAKSPFKTCYFVQYSNRNNAEDAHKGPTQSMKDNVEKVTLHWANVCICKKSVAFVVRKINKDMEAEAEKIGDMTDGKTLQEKQKVFLKATSSIKTEVSGAKSPAHEMLDYYKITSDDLKQIILKKARAIQRAVAEEMNVELYSNEKESEDEQKSDLAVEGEGTKKSDSGCSYLLVMLTDVYLQIEDRCIQDYGYVLFPDDGSQNSIDFAEKCASKLSKVFEYGFASFPLYFVIFTNEHFSEPLRIPRLRPIKARCLDLRTKKCFSSFPSCTQNSPPEPDQSNQFSISNSSHYSVIGSSSDHHSEHLSSSARPVLKSGTKLLNPGAPSFVPKVQSTQLSSQKFVLQHERATSTSNSVLGITTQTGSASSHVPFQLTFGTVPAKGDQNLQACTLTHSFAPLGDRQSIFPESTPTSSSHSDFISPELRNSFQIITSNDSWKTQNYANSMPSSTYFVNDKTTFQLSHRLQLNESAPNSAKACSLSSPPSLRKDIDCDDDVFECDSITGSEASSDVSSIDTESTSSTQTMTATHASVSSSTASSSCDGSDSSKISFSHLSTVSSRSSERDKKSQGNSKDGTENGSAARTDELIAKTGNNLDIRGNCYAEDESVKGKSVDDQSNLKSCCDFDECTESTFDIISEDVHDLFRYIPCNIRPDARIRSICPEFCQCDLALVRIQDLLYLVEGYKLEKFDKMNINEKFMNLKNQNLNDVKNNQVADKSNNNIDNHDISCSGEGESVETGTKSTDNNANSSNDVQVNANGSSNIDAAENSQYVTDGSPVSGQDGNAGGGVDKQEQQDSATETAENKRNENSSAGNTENSDNNAHQASDACSPEISDANSTCKCSGGLTSGKNDSENNGYLLDNQSDNPKDILTAENNRSTEKSDKSESDNYSQNGNKREEGSIDISLESQKKKNIDSSGGIQMGNKQDADQHLTICDPKADQASECFEDDDEKESTKQISFTKEGSKEEDTENSDNISHSLIIKSDGVLCYFADISVKSIVEDINEIKMKIEIEKILKKLEEINKNVKDLLNENKNSTTKVSHPQQQNNLIDNTSLEKNSHEKLMVNGNCDSQEDHSVDSSCQQNSASEQQTKSNMSPSVESISASETETFNSDSESFDGSENDSSFKIQDKENSHEKEPNIGQMNELDKHSYNDSAENEEPTIKLSTDQDTANIGEELFMENQLAPSPFNEETNIPYSSFDKQNDESFSQRNEEEYSFDSFEEDSENNSENILRSSETNVSTSTLSSSFSKSFIKDPDSDLPKQLPTLATKSFQNSRKESGIKSSPSNNSSNRDSEAMDNANNEMNRKNTSLDDTDLDSYSTLSDESSFCSDDSSISFMPVLALT
ncbi:uncharacterized protein MONOS_9322 [Monocercomonoides exilis]|uniref:uncharacterized protein n=1 Tax=Monocercomonoides exilis TaxID=2049356 RepID=UPI003559CB2F|nr:hypothetical protein MONOS_9322 [Monocercomonoides exilis]|eukprot:MONOS_9322.1-p1 / transcript=MONOS_9322.1 / gene=MONOS_9322 / organism=Monocercomonoides_exilis_PA203 / gene_product=unspecified product / transcript_product=unspecified product / location=Mono_scaffold00380:45450-50410(-) / protein_length=1460 / sequence_SO=supercontig / SO=protein_coding / is_pseudo=false